MNRVIVGFSKTKSNWLILSPIIQWVEKTPYSHVYIRFTDYITNRQLVFESSLGMVHFCTFDSMKVGNDIVEEWAVSIDDLQYRKLWNFMLNRLELRYGFLELVWIGLKKLTGIKFVSGDGEQTQICSELAARVCEALGIPVPGNLDYITPRDLQKIVANVMEKVS